MPNITIDDFLPADYSIPSSEGWKYTKIERDIELRIRILSRPIVGFEYFSQDGQKRKPMRSKAYPTEIIDPAINKFTGKPEIPQEFWAMKVWNYNTKQVEIFQTNKNAVKSVILALARDPDYGSPKWYDLKIKKTWVDKATTYSVLPAQIKPLDEEIQITCDDTYVDLEALFEWKNPFER